MDHDHGPSCFCVKIGDEHPPPAEGVRLDEAIGRGVAIWRMIGDRMTPMLADRSDDDTEE